MRYLIILILLSCGKPKNKCISGEEMRLRCKADNVQRYFPIPVPQFEDDNCDLLYQNQMCY
jgi:hypothetical protein